MFALLRLLVRLKSQLSLGMDDFTLLMAFLGILAWEVLIIGKYPHPWIVSSSMVLKRPNNTTATWTKAGPNPKAASSAILPRKLYTAERFFYVFDANLSKIPRYQSYFYIGGFFARERYKSRLLFG